MAKHPEPLYAFNRGLISPLAAARVDLKRTALSAEEQTNFVPRILGSMQIRPGLQHLISSYATTRYIPFVFAIDDTALIEMSAGQMRVLVNDVLLSRVAVGTTITNGDFTGSLAGWTDLDEAGAVSDYATVGGTSYATLSGTGPNAAIREQVLTIPPADVGKAHGLRLVILSGNVTVRIGTSSGGVQILGETELYAGTHSIVFTPTAGTVYLQILNRAVRPSWVDSVGIEAGGTLTLPTLYDTTQRLNELRFEQSADVVYLSCSGVQQYKIERRDGGSWSVTNYTPDDGPFRVQNLSDITLTPSAYTGDMQLIASRSLFIIGSSSQLGALFRVTHAGQRSADTLGALNAVTGNIRVTGVGTDRALTIYTTYTGWTGTLTLQRSVGEVGLWTDVQAVTVPITYNDTFDNQIIYYRLKVTAYTGGSVATVLSYAVGYTTGVCRIYSVVSRTQALALVITPFSALTASADWAEGEWSAYRGYPSAVALHGGRLCWAGKDKHWESISDAYSSFDDNQVGDSGPISRSIGKGPVDKIRWMLSTDHLVMGGQGAEFVIRSSSLDEPITPTNFNMKAYTERGSGSVAALAVDSSILFVDRSESRVIELTGDQWGRYAASDVTAIVPEVCTPAVVRLVVQRLPDTRVHAVLSDGTVAMLVYDKQEEVRCWVKVTTDGLILDAVVLPGTNGEDQVYYVVQRTVGGIAVYYLEKWARESESLGGTANKMADSFVHYSGAATATISGLSHLEGRTVVCWADGADKGTFVVSGGTITLPAAVSVATVGLGYRARFKSVKLGYMGQNGPNLANHQTQRVDHVTLLLANTHAQGIKYGTDFDYMDDMPLYDDGDLIVEGTVYSAYNNNPIELNGTFSVDTKLCLEANAPRPCTVLGAVLSIKDQ